MSETKYELRKRFRRLRREIPPEQHLAWSRAVAANLLAKVPAGEVALFSAFGAEPSLRPVHRALAKEGRSIAYPRCLPDRTLAFVRVADPAELQPGAHGILEPLPSVPVPIDQITVFAIPLLAFGKDGAQLGSGGGYYDRTLGAVPRERRWGVGFDLQLCGGVPMDEHDLYLGRVVTESGVRFL